MGGRDEKVGQRRQIFRPGKLFRRENRLHGQRRKNFCGYILLSFGRIIAERNCHNYFKSQDRDDDMIKILNYLKTMISYIEGKIKMRGNKFLAIMANGLGYKVYALPDTLAKSKNEASLWTHLRVREDALDLYGFESYPELEFLKL